MTNVIHRDALEAVLLEEVALVLENVRLELVRLRERVLDHLDLVVAGGE